MFCPGFVRSLAFAGAMAATTFLPPLVAHAQSAGTRIPVGLNPVSIAANPLTNKVYVANADEDTVTVINGSTGATSTLPAGDYPAWVAINAETNTVYVSNLISANTTVINGATDTVTTTLLSGGGGWTAVNPITNSTYVLRYGAGDEVNVIQGDGYVLTSATRSYEPTALALNPTNNWLYIVHRTTGDVVALDMTTPMPYPPLKCPNGSGGFRPQPGDYDPHDMPCIDVPDTPVAVAVNPVTNRIYALSNVSSSQISVINGTNNTFVSLTPPGTLGTARAIAANPVTNKIYAAFSSAVVVVDGATNAMTVIPAGSNAGGPVAIGVNVLTNMVYVPSADGSMLVLDGASGSTSTVAITAGANAIAVNPITNTIWVLDSGGGVTPVTGAPGSATSTGIATTITALPGNSSGTSGSITLNASSAMTPAPLNSVRKVYFRIGTGAWTAATGAGPYTASFSGLAPGVHTIQAFATNGLEAPSINTDLANVPVVGNIAAYTFTASATSKADASISLASSANPAQLGQSVTFTTSVTGSAGTPTGSATFRNGTTDLCPNVPLASGAASCSTSALTEGTHSITVSYSGDAAYNAAVSSALAQTISATAGTLVNLSTRGQVLTGNDVMIGGFIIGGSTSKTVVVRARGPSLSALGVPNALANPVLSLFSGQTVIASNDDWQTAANAAALQSSGFAPPHSLESAVMVTLAPGAYTAIVSGVGGGTGVGMVEVFEVDRPEVPLINISTRGRVLTGSDVMIGGFIIQGNGPQTVVVRARGPSMSQLGVPGTLADPMLQLVRSSDQSTIAINDNWGSAPNAAQISSSGFAPPDAQESAILVTLEPGAYTAIVTGVGGGTGVGLVEVFRVQ
jgi:YVTN family beta-propeller protein